MITDKGTVMGTGALWQYLALRTISKAPRAEDNPYGIDTPKDRIRELVQEESTRIHRQANNVR